VTAGERRVGGGRAAPGQQKSTPWATLVAAGVVVGLGIAACGVAQGRPGSMAPAVAPTAAALDDSATPTRPEDAGASSTPEISDTGSRPSNEIKRPETEPSESPWRYREHMAPDPGPGLVGCGDTACKAGAEICAPTKACGPNWPDSSCVDPVEVKARKFERGKDRCPPCPERVHTKACDGSGDCPAGQLCCLNVDYEPHENCGVAAHQYTYECRPLAARPGPSTCTTAEMCSAKDPICRRPGTTCAVDPNTARGTCESPRKLHLRCGKGYCRKEQLCIRSDPSEPKPSFSCLDVRTGPDVSTGPDDWTEKRAKEAGLWIYRCHGGRDCAQDEVCYWRRGGTDCVLQVPNDNRMDTYPPHAICRDWQDCLAFCDDQALTTCKHNICECRPRCKTDNECRSGWEGCTSVMIDRIGYRVVGKEFEAYCDSTAGRCDCREVGPPAP